jgi:hypothetical protein
MIAMTREETRKRHETPTKDTKTITHCCIIEHDTQLHRRVVATVETSCSYKEISPAGRNDSNFKTGGGYNVELPAQLS